MSKGELEDRQQREYEAKVAATLGVTVDELEKLDWSLEANESDDGALYGYRVYFAKGSDPAILAKIEGLIDGRWVSIGPVL